MLNLEQTCNNPHLHSPVRTVIRTELSAWACQPFCCQRTFIPIPSECSGCTGTCLAGLTRPLCAFSPSSSPSAFAELVSQQPSHYWKIKNPASSAGLNRHTVEVLRVARLLPTVFS